jgi:hypothetical protein
MTAPADPKPTCRTCHFWWPNFYRVYDQWRYAHENYKQANACLGSNKGEYVSPSWSCKGWEKI